MPQTGQKESGDLQTRLNESETQKKEMQKELKKLKRESEDKEQQYQMESGKLQRKIADMESQKAQAYQDLELFTAPHNTNRVEDVIKSLNDPKGASAIAIQRSIQSEHPDMKAEQCKALLRAVLLEGLDSGRLRRPPGSKVGRGLVGRFLLGTSAGKLPAIPETEEEDPPVAAGNLTFDLEEPCTPAAYVQRVQEKRDRLVSQCQEAEKYLNYRNLPAHALEQVRIAVGRSRLITSNSTSPLARFEELCHEAMTLGSDNPYKANMNDLDAYREIVELELSEVQNSLKQQIDDYKSRENTLQREFEGECESLQKAVDITEKLVQTKG
ncbi:PREDICTED: uncharacterized protein LOC109462141 [Branchiostoma belcheri]|uniref:Uncharacterized protein LOC109462141 n=1 Tax=Branchiostoma belcheri TaxID=7741 RepID=A0A6P4XU86_BRABE|nr:PREDICTED: uncharacterized protein LOC109462141 [Branchiostoma belcheri]